MEATNGGLIAAGGPAAAFLAAMESGKGISVNALRTNAVLRKDEWQEFDKAIIKPARDRLVGVGALVSRGLTFDLPNAMGKTEVQWETSSDLTPAQETMDGINFTENDAIKFVLNTIPAYITHKDFYINLRKLEASRNLGESLDVSQAESAARQVAERIEDSLFNGSSITVNGNSAPGLTNEGNRNTADFKGSVSWSASAKTGEDILEDLLTMKQGEIDDLHFGPYILFISTNMETKLDEDFKANSDKTIRERLLQVSSIQDIIVADHLTADNVLLVQTTSDVVDIVMGLQPTTVFWQSQGGFRLNFKVMSIMLPRVKARQDGKSGIFHMS